MFLLVETVGLLFLVLLGVIPLLLAEHVIVGHFVDLATIHHVLIQTVEAETGGPVHLHLTVHFLERRSLLPILYDGLGMISAIAVVRYFHRPLLGESEEIVVFLLLPACLEYALLDPG